MYRFGLGHFGFASIVFGVLVIAATRRFPSQATRLELAGTLMVVGGLVLIGVHLATLFTPPS